MSRVIEIMIAPDGSSRIETLGFVGSGCREATRFIERALGQSLSQQLKAEFHQAAPQEQQIQLPS